MSCGIYKITNTINGKAYIGKSVNIEKRFNEHKRAATNMAISVAIRKYGVENFAFDILETCDERVLDQRESYWIDKYNTYHGEGYNSAPGGEGASHPVKISNHDLVEIKHELMYGNMPITQIAKKFGVSATAVSSINTGKSRVDDGETYPLRENTRRKINICRKDLRQKMRDCGGDYDAVGEYYGCSGVTIRNLCREHDVHVPKTTYKNVQIQPYHSQPICGICENDPTIIVYYPSIQRAASELSVNPNSIRKALARTVHRSHGFIWNTIDRYEQTIVGSQAQREDHKGIS